MRGQGRVFRRGEIWWCAYFRRGKEFRESSGSTKEADAKRLLKKRLGEIHAGSFIAPAKERLTVPELLEAVVLDYEVNGRKNLRNVRAHIKRLEAAFGFDRAIDVTEERIERYKLSRIEEGAAPATVNRELAVLRRGFSLAVQRRLLNRSPRFSLLREAPPRQGFVERGDFARLAEALPEPIRDLASFAFLCGWRKREITSLTWAEVDLAERLVWLRSERSKNGRGRVLPLEGELLELIEKRKRLRVVTKPSGETSLSPLVFHRGDGKPLGDIRKSWRKACEAAGFSGLLFHDLRRSAVRSMVRGGTPEATVMRISGHRTRAVFLRYDVVSDRDLRDAVLRTQAYLAGEPSESKVQTMPKSSEGA
ncbi:MAG: tyrosine-type recombinase/integrase [Planctomycetes bacterium]|nr:tyrosine-type recombinase/integrase [Planctomycetota bacterium]